MEFYIRGDAHHITWLLWWHADFPSTAGIRCVVRGKVVHKEGYWSDRPFLSIGGAVPKRLTKVLVGGSKVRRKERHFQSSVVSRREIIGCIGGTQRWRARRWKGHAMHICERNESREGVYIYV